MLAAACVRPCEDGVEVQTANAKVEKRRAVLTELLMADQPPTDEDPKETTTGDNLLLELARRYGLHGKPTLLNNVETFASVPIILRRGAEWWKAQGVNGGFGLKFFSVSGHAEAPGRLLRARGDDGRRGDRAGPRGARRRGGGRDPARRRLDELPRPGLPRPAAHVRAAGAATMSAARTGEAARGAADRAAATPCS